MRRNGSGRAVAWSPASTLPACIGPLSKQSHISSGHFVSWAQSHGLAGLIFNVACMQSNQSIVINNNSPAPWIARIIETTLRCHERRRRAILAAGAERQPPLLRYRRPPQRACPGGVGQPEHGGSCAGACVPKPKNASRTTSTQAPTTSPCDCRLVSQRHSPSSTTTGR